VFGSKKEKTSGKGYALWEGSLKGRSGLLLLCGKEKKGGDSEKGKKKESPSNKNSLIQASDRRGSMNLEGGNSPHKAPSTGGAFVSKKSKRKVEEFIT